MPSERRVTSAAIRTRKGRPFPVVTAYDAAFARCVESAGIDVAIVGDSLGMVVLGHPSTAPVDLVDMQRHSAAVARATRRLHAIVDMPFGSYEASDSEAISSAVTLVKAGASSVKLEGGTRAAARIAAIVSAGIPVCGHVGVLPQTAGIDAGFRRRIDRDVLLADARAVEDAGAFALVLEMVDARIAAEITAACTIPTIGIGSGPDCDAQVLVLHDVLGLYPEAPPFAKRYADLGRAATEALRAYADDVRGAVFPPRSEANGRTIEGDGVYTLGGAV